MSDAPVWKKVGVDVQTALSAALTISAISKANPAVVTYGVGDIDPANGDHVLLEVTGMDRVNLMVVEVANVNPTANTFECKGLNSTNFGTFVSGTGKVVTYGKTMSTMMDISSNGGAPKWGDNSDLHSEMDKEVKTGYSALKFTSNSRFVPDDAALLALQDAASADTPLCIRFRFANGAKVAFNANIGASLVPTGSAGNVVQTPLEFSVRGFPSAWAN